LTCIANCTAVSALKERGERCDRPNATQRTRATVCPDAVKKGGATLIWTAIGPRFKERATEDFSVEAAIRYLSGLRDPARALALDYIRNAPEEVVTPVRTKTKEVLLS
jgi:hypothetical protein